MLSIRTLHLLVFFRLQSSIESELQEVEKSRASLQSQVDAQNICPEDIDKMNAEKEQLVKTLSTISSSKEEISRLFWEREVQVQRKIDELEKLAQEFNLAAEKIGMIPSTAANAQGREFQLLINSNASSASEITNFPIKEQFFVSHHCTIV